MGIYIYILVYANGRITGTLESTLTSGCSRICLQRLVKDKQNLSRDCLSVSEQGFQPESSVTKPYVTRVTLNECQTFGVIRYAQIV